MLILQFLAKLFKILRSAASPNQIAAGFVLGMIIGFTPFWSLHNLLIIILIFILNVNIATAIFSFAIFSGVAYLFDPWIHDFGYYLLVDVTALNVVWTAMYNIPVIALSRFNNTIVLGSLIISLILTIPFLTVEYAENAEKEFHYRTKTSDRFMLLRK